MINWNDYPHNNSTISLYLNTVSQSGLPTTIASGGIGILVDNSPSYLTTGIVLTPNFASLTGIHLIEIPSGTITGNNVTCTVFYTSGVVDGINVTRRLAGAFSVGRFGQGPSNFTGLIIGSDGLVQTDVRKYYGVSPATSGDFTAIMKTSLYDASTSGLNNTFTITGGIPNVNVSKWGNATVPSGDLTTTMKSSVNTEVLDVLTVDTFAQPGSGTPPATGSMLQWVGYLYKNWRNRKDQTASQYSLYNDDAVTVDQKSSISGDNTLVVVNEITAGP